MTTEKEWEEHCNGCLTCKKVGKYNNRGGTTENYHAFVSGYEKALTILKKQHDKEIEELKKKTGKYVNFNAYQGYKLFKENKSLKKEIEELKEQKAKS